MKRNPFIILLALLIFLFFLPPNSHARWNDLSNIVSPNWFAELNSYPVEIVVQLEDRAKEETFKAWLNGKNITDKFVYNGTENKLTATVGPDDGLRIMERGESRWWRKSWWRKKNILRTRVRSPKWKRDIDFRTFYVKVDAMKIIGSEGGVLKVTNPKSPIYGTELSFPAGCLDQDTMFSVSYDPSYDDEDLMATPVIVNSPDIQLQEDVIITFPLKKEFTEITTLLLVIFDDEEGTFVPNGKLDEVNPDDTTISFPVSHFSVFSIINPIDLLPDLFSLCDKLGQSYTAHFPTANPLIWISKEVTITDSPDPDPWDGDCMGRCGIGCPDTGDKDPDLLDCENVFRYTRACAWHDACQRYHTENNNLLGLVNCHTIIFPFCINDCLDAPICQNAREVCTWPYIRRDLAGTSNQPYGSKIGTSLNLTEQFNIPGIPVGTILTGDVDNDGKLEIVHVSGNMLRIFDKSGDLKIPPVTLGSSSCHLSMLADVNGDGVLDIGIGTGEASSLKAYFYDGNGNLLHTLSRSAGYDSYMFPYAILENGKCLVTLNAGYSHDNKNRGWAVYDLNTQDEIWNFRIGPFAWLASIADINNDGKYEITSASGTPHNGCCADGYNHNGTTTCDDHLWLIVVDEDGNQEVAKKYPDTEDNGTVSHIFVDLNKDKEMEILGFENHDPVYYHGYNQIHLYDRYGNTLHTFDGPYDGGAWSYAVADIDSDGKNEVVASAPNGGNETFVLNDKLEKIDEIQGEGFVQLVVDLNGDYANDIVLINESGTVKVLDNQLQMIDSYSVGGEFGVAAYTQHVIASDIDDDGIVELICGNDDGIHVLEFAQ